MRMLHLNGQHVVFFCDRCGKRLNDDDPGTPHWEDYDRFLETVGIEDEVETELLCGECVVKKWSRINE